MLSRIAISQIKASQQNRETENANIQIARGPAYIAFFLTPIVPLEKSGEGQRPPGRPADQLTFDIEQQGWGSVSP
jgi:hypothetical protein